MRTQWSAVVIAWRRTFRSNTAQFVKLRSPPSQLHMKITLKAPNGKRQTVRGPHLERALRMQGWTDADTKDQKQRAKVKAKRNGERRAE